MSFALRLIEDRLGPGGQLTLPPRPRVIYVREGRALVADTIVTTGTAWHHAGTATVAADGDATVLRFEVVIGARARESVDGRASVAGKVESRQLLEHAIELDPARGWLMRCDRVDFAPAGVALPHGHKGGGIRCLLAGALEVRVGGAPPRVMHPGDAWFESGREPVLATASPDMATAFVRVSILPREIRGQSSIVYVNPADAARGRPRQYTVYVDEPIDLPTVQP